MTRHRTNSQDLIRAISINPLNKKCPKSLKGFRAFFKNFALLTVNAQQFQFLLAIILITCSNSFSVIILHIFDESSRNATAFNCLP